MCTVQFKVHTVCIIKLRDTYVYIVKGDGIASWHATKNIIHTYSNSWALATTAMTTRIVACCIVAIYTLCQL